jgi:S-adenosylmethionine decarboxylase
MWVLFTSKKLDEGIGWHCVAELGRGCPDLLNDEEYIKKSLEEAAKRSGATFLSVTSHKFEPQGVTAVALLSESHISIHTWPEHGYAAVDAFTCGSHCDPKDAISHLKHCFRSTEDHTRLFTRVVPSQFGS